jgi:Flp pilus assembly protein CpaB
VATASAFSYTQAMRRPFRLNRRRVLSLGFMVAAMLGGLAYLNGLGQQPTYPVLIAARDVARGAVITANDLQPQRVALPDSMAAAAVPASALSRVVGQRLAEPVHAGVPLLEVQMARPTELVTGFQRVAFPVGPEHAAGGRLDVGDAVRVYVTTDRGKPAARTMVGLAQAVVSAVGYQDVGLASSGGSDIAPRSRGKWAWIEVLVDDAQAGGFLQILAAGDPDVTVLPPVPATSTPAGASR